VASLLSTFEEARLTPDIRRTVVYALSRRPQPEAAAALRAVLQSEEGNREQGHRSDDDESVAYAARALGLLKDDEASSDLLGLAMSTNSSIAVQSLSSLLRIDGAGGRGAHANEVRAVALRRADDAIPGVAVAALRLLGRFPGDADVVARLETEVLRKGWRAQTALVSLARVDAARAEKALAEILDGGKTRDGNAPSLELKLGAVDSLEYLSKKAGEDELQRLLKDKNARVRAAAVSYLSKKGGDGREAWLAAALADSDPAVRGAALEASAPILDGPSSSSSQGSLSHAWARAFGASFREKEPDFVVSALDAAAARKSGGKELLLAHADDADAVAREKARRLLVERFGAAAEDFEPVPVRTRFAPADYEAFARTALASLLSAEVTTARGSFWIELDAEEAPLTVLNFVALARKGFFDRGAIHRVVPDFVIQGGDPRGDGTGGPGWAIRDEINPLRYGRGVVGMALGGPDTGGSQWFVTLSPQPHLDGGYTVFGRVTAGMEVVDRIEQDDALVSVRVTERARPSPPPGALP
jgi:cyclophilin family peptidyl-prolyl cis-trans isomerase/HEAT repeat protein